MLVFYNGPTPPNGLFDDFLAIPALVKNIKTRDFSNFIGSTISNSTTSLGCVNNLKLALRGNTDLPWQFLLLGFVQ